MSTKNKRSELPTIPSTTLFQTIWRGSEEVEVSIYFAR